MDTLNQKLAKLRNDNHLTQTDVADRLNIKCSTFSQMERNGIISAERFFKMSEIYGVSPCKIFYGYEPCKPPENPNILKQPEPPKPERTTVVLTKKEENMIKMLHNFSKDNYNRVMKLVQDIYQEGKK